MYVLINVYGFCTRSRIIRNEAEIPTCNHHLFTSILTNANTLANYSEIILMTSDWK